jgi:hypothetical protein
MHIKLAKHKGKTDKPEHEIKEHLAVKKTQARTTLLPHFFWPSSHQYQE